jgi:molybdenum cofactor cytidylyltransferase
VLRAGGDVEGALVCLGDMPFVRAGHVEALLAEFAASGARAICAPSFERKRGNPVLWPARYFPELRALAGDSGARALLEEHADAVRSVAIDDAAVTLDVDTPEALAALRDRGPGGGGAQRRAW